MTKPPSLPIRDPYTYLQRRHEASQRMLARVMHENRVRDECLEIAMKALGLYRTSADSVARRALNNIKQRLAQLEPEEETE